MLEKIYKNWLPGEKRRRRRALEKIRSEIEGSGYGLEHITDSDLETAVTYAGGAVDNALPLTAKRTYWVLRRLSRVKKDQEQAKK